MNIEDLTIKELREIASMFSKNKPSFYSKFIGRYVIVRSRNEGMKAWP